MKRISKLWISLLLLTLSSLFGQAAFGYTIVLEGQNKGDTNNWYAGNLQNWQELDYIPCRVHFTGAQGNNQTIVIYFEHYNKGFPGFQNLYGFTTSSNVVLTAGPTLSAPPSASTWSYTFTVNITDKQAAYVWFTARMAAGAHLNTGSSLALSGNPTAMGNLQVHKPAAGPGTPDLMIVKSGPATARQGDVITYTLSYSNKLDAFYPATGVQAIDILPPEVTMETNNMPAGCEMVGDTVYWDLTNVPAGTGGLITFQVVVNSNTPYGYSFTNFSQVLSAENDQDYSDNTSTLVTTTPSCRPPSVVVSPLSATKCPGESAGFTATANGTGPLNYQWRKAGGIIAGATASALALDFVSNNDSGAYDVIVSNSCGTVTSAAATLTVNTNVSASALLSLVRCPGNSA